MKRDVKTFIILLLAIILGGLVAGQFILGDTKTFEIKDSCGRFINLMSHTIENEEVCKSRCRSQCIAIDYTFVSVQFEAHETECNECTCNCRS